MIYYIADTHFGDERIMRLARRPFETVDQMNTTVIINWNNKVSATDDVYIVGDFAASDEVAIDMLKQLNGRKHLVVGNHDSILLTAITKFEDISVIKKIDDNGRSVVLCHYPLMSYENSIYGGYHVFGHIHNNEADIATRLLAYLPRSLHAGIDIIGFEPQTLDELIKIKENHRQ